MKVWLPAVLLAIALHSSAWALTETEIEEQVDAAISERHPTDTPAWWRKLGSEAPPIIRKLYEREQGTYRRIRLLEGLSAFDDPSSTEFLKKQAESSPDSAVRTAAIRGVARSTKDVDFVSRYLKTDDVQLRFAVLQALKGMSDPRADAVVEKHLSTEKSPWIAQRLRGEMPKPAVTGLVPVSSSEDRINPQLGGLWRGYWMLPKTGAKGLRSRAAVLKLSVDSATELRGELRLAPEKGGAELVLPLLRVEAKASRFQGAVGGMAAAPHPMPSPRPHIPDTIAVDAELAEYAGSYILSVRSPQVAGVGVLRRD